MNCYSTRLVAICLGLKDVVLSARSQVVGYAVRMADKNSGVRSQKSGVSMEGHHFSPTRFMFFGEPQANILFCVLTYGAWIQRFNAGCC